MKKQNFTLIELLIVIAIIAVLASMLMPALGSARAHGRSISCVNNLKQLGTTTTYYKDDYDSYYMPHQQKNYNFKGSVRDLNWPGLLGICGYLNNVSPLLCREMESSSDSNRKSLVAAAGIIVTFPVFSSLSFIDYGYNYAWLGSGRRIPGTPTSANMLQGPPAKDSQIRRPSQTILMVDCGSYDNNSYGWYCADDDMNQTWGGRPMTRHSGRANVLWNDGHVTSEKGKCNMRVNSPMASYPNVYSSIYEIRDRSNADNNWDRN